MREKIAFIFPGQGAQYVGMGKDVYENFDSAKKIFDLASNVTGIDLIQLCFEGPKEDLVDTVLCQVAIYTVSIACLEALKYSLTTNNLELPSSVAAAGLSLGEYSALVYSDCLSFQDGVKLVHKRGQFMKEAAQETKGSMASILGLTQEEVEEICKTSGTQIANLNCPGQFVISGPTENIKKAILETKKYEKAKAIPLRVSGAYHSKLMSKARDKLSKYIQDIKFSPPNTLFISNVTGKYHIKPEEIKQNLITQIDSPVYWQKSIELILDTGVTKFLEVGPGKVLAGLIRRIDSSLEVFNIETKADVIGFIDEWK